MLLLLFESSFNIIWKQEQAKVNVSLIKNDPVVQLVRMPPCHGGGRGFESRPDRRSFVNFF